MSYQRNAEMLVDHEQDNAIPRFYLKSKVDGQRTKELGRTVHCDVEWVDIMQPGHRDIVSRAVRESDKQRWPRQYQAFVRNMEQVDEGLPLEHWPACPPSAVMDYRLMHVHTVEQLAKLTDGALDGLPIGTRKLRDLARAYVDGGDAGLAHLAEENEQLKRDIAQLKQQFAELAGEAPKPKRRGRPPKARKPEAETAED